MCKNITVTLRGMDSAGREIEFQFGADNTTELKTVFADLKPWTDKIKPLPVRSSGYGGKPKKVVVYLEDAPKCPTHGTPMTVYEHKPGTPDVRHYWTCGKYENGSYCKAKVNTAPSPAQVAKWKELNPQA